MTSNPESRPHDGHIQQSSCSCVLLGSNRRL